MVLEATIICLDNSECSRNADYLPSRLEAQTDAANLISGMKTNVNPESAVGLLTTAGERVVVRVAPTQDLGKMLQGLHDIPIGGEADIVRAIKTAQDEGVFCQSPFVLQLALKHRVNKNQRQRIVLFVGSPVAASEKQLEVLGRILKKNNVSIDIISFGEIESNTAKLQKLFEVVNNNNTSHIITCPADASCLLSDSLLSSPVLRDVDANGDASEIINEVGVDPTTDPDLYMALELSLQEERSRQARGNQADVVGQPEAGVTAEEPLQAVTQSTQNNNPTSADISAMEGIDDELRQALLLSLADFQNENADPAQEAAPDRVITSGDSVELPAAGDVGVLTQEEAARPVGGDAARVATAEEVAASQVVADSPKARTPITPTMPSQPSAIHQIIGNLPGIDMNDPRLLEALQMVESEEKRANESRKEKDKEDAE